MTGPVIGAPLVVGAGPRVSSLVPVGGVAVGTGVVQPASAAILLEDITDLDGVVDAPVGVPLCLVRQVDGRWQLSRGPLALEWTQTVAATVWGPIHHQLGRRPAAWSLFDDAGRECGEYVVQHLDLDTCRVSMDVPTAGVFRFI